MIRSHSSSRTLRAHNAQQQQQQGSASSSSGTGSNAAVNSLEAQPQLESGRLCHTQQQNQNNHHNHHRFGSLGAVAGGIMLPQFALSSYGMMLPQQQQHFYNVHDASASPCSYGTSTSSSHQYQLQRQQLLQL
jgi:hypothetical protein